MEMSKIFRNINVLDFSAASEQALDEVSRLENVNVLLYSKATSGLLASVSQQNINIRAEMPDNSVLTQANGRYEITSLNNDKPLFVVANGTVVIRPGVTAEALEQRVAGIVANGIIFCPEGLKGIVQQKIANLNGRFVTYMDDADLVGDNVRLSNTYLHTLRKGSRISFAGKVVMLDDVDASLLDEKLHAIEFMDTFVIREDLLPAVAGKIVNPHKTTIVAVPKDTYHVDGDLSLDAGVLRRIGKRRIHAAGIIRIESDVKPEALAASVESLHADKMILCKNELKEEVLNKTTDPSVPVLGYNGKLRVVEGEYKLTASELRYAKEELAFIVYGVLDVAPEVDPQLLFDSLDSIVNYGIINGSGEQCGVIQTKLLVNKGVVSDRNDEQENDVDSSDSAENDGHIYICNANYCKL